MTKISNLVVIDRALIEERILKLKNRNKLLKSKCSTLCNEREQLEYAHDYDMNSCRIVLLRQLLKDGNCLEDYLSDAFDAGCQSTRDNLNCYHDGYPVNDKNVEKDKQEYLTNKEW